MTINSPEFYIFLFTVVLVYFLVPLKTQWLALLFSSYLFYFYVSGWIGIFLVVTTITTFFAGKLIQHENGSLSHLIRSNPPPDEKRALRDRFEKRKQIWIIFYLLINFGILAVIKYSGFFESIIFQVLRFTNLPDVAFLLPLGISFYTFQAASYVFDVSRGHIETENNFLKMALYVGYFPQLTLGPISRYQHLADQLTKEHKFDVTRFKFGVQLILWGLIKKMVIADRIDIFVDSVFSNYPQYKGLTIYFGALFYMVQVYADFSGAIDIVRGVSKIFGINMVSNFHQPFFAKSISDFWRRWHITLGGWFKEYVFYPLALTKSFGTIGKFSRKFLPQNYAKLVPPVIAMLITFTLIGLWHGPNMTYVAYGLYNGFFIILGILFGSKFEAEKVLGLRTDKLPWKTIQVVFTLFIGGIGRYILRAPSLAVTSAMLAQTVRTIDFRQFIDGTLFQTGMGPKEFTVFCFAFAFMLMVELLHAKGIKIRAWIAARPIVFRWTIYLSAVMVLTVFGVYGSDYNPSDFIYRAF